MIFGGQKGAALHYIYIYTILGIAKGQRPLPKKILYLQAKHTKFLALFGLNLQKYIISGGCKGQPFFS